MTGLQGNLKDFDITDILQLIHMNKKDGCLEIKTNDDIGKIFFQNGVVIHAETNDNTGENAIKKILMWSEGDFIFQADVHTDRKTIELPIQHLMLEAARQIDEWKQIEKIIPSLDLVIKMVENPETGTENIKLTSEEWKMLTFVDDESTIKELAQKVNQSEFETAKIFVGLISSGLVYTEEKIDIQIPDIEEGKQEEKNKKEEKEEKKSGFKRFFSR